MKWEGVWGVSLGHSCSITVSCYYNIALTYVLTCVTYVEYDNSPTEGSFYEQEIQKTQTSIISQLDAVLKTRTRKGKKEHFVHCLDGMTNMTRG